MTNYGERSGSGTVGQANIRNDDDVLLDIPDDFLPENQPKLPYEDSPGVY